MEKVTRAGYIGNRGEVSPIVRDMIQKVNSGELDAAKFEDFLTRNAEQIKMFAKELANIDHLTQVPNRKAFQDFLDLLPKGEPYSLMIFDIDHFKDFNDTYGHQTGDLVLKTLSVLVASETRIGDFFGRWGGEEFAVILPGMKNKELLEERAEEIRGMVERMIIPTEKGNLKCTISIGAGINNGNKPRDSFFEIVDKNVYNAKRAGRNKVVMAE